MTNVDTNFNRLMVAASLASGQQCLDHSDEWVQDPEKGKDYVIGWLQAVVRSVIKHSPELTSEIATARVAIDARSLEWEGSSK